MKFRIKHHYSDTDLITGCLRGERKYQESLYNQHGSTMFAICLRYANDYYQAEDMLQEGFIKVFNNLKNFRSEGSFEGWMKRIFVNTAIEWLRKNKMMNEMYDVENVQMHIVQEDCFSQLAADDLMKLIQSLSPGYRTVFNLFSIEGYTHKEIAEIMNINEGTSKSQLARARHILQKMVVQTNKVQYAAAVL